ncbi:MAG: hypothetical protein KIH63_000245 [Candidatus Saccharibacteria bacterium]|nr:hypothetical protein [Candidatus Saccharibacteria bacterium]
MIESLAVDIERDPSFHAHHLDTMDDSLRNFVQIRAQQLVSVSDNPLGACLSLVAELHSLAERADFETSWHPRLDTL